MVMDPNQLDQDLANAIIADATTKARAIIAENEEQIRLTPLAWVKSQNPDPDQIWAIAAYWLDGEDEDGNPIEGADDMQLLAFCTDIPPVEEYAATWSELIGQLGADCRGRGISPFLWFTAHLTQGHWTGYGYRLSDEPMVWGVPSENECNWMTLETQPTILEVGNFFQKAYYAK